MCIVMIFQISKCEIILKFKVWKYRVSVSQDLKIFSKFLIAEVNKNHS